MASQDWFEKDFYATLGVPKDADEAAIKKQYRKLARELHPDRNPGDTAAETRFKQVGEAYAVLSDTQQRAEYDQIRTMGAGPRFTAGSPGGNGGFEDIFSSLFGGGAGSGGFGNMFGGGRAAPQQGRDLQAATTVSFRQAVKGDTVTLNLAGKDTRVRIPAGIKSGQKIRLAGRGQPGVNGGPAGNLVLVVHVEPHPVFTMDGQNLRVTLPLTFAEAALGAEVDVPTLDGDLVKLRVPAGTPVGRVLRVKGRGVDNGKTVGDLLAMVSIAVPNKLSKAARKAVEDFAAATTDADPRYSLYDQAKR